MSCLRTMRFSMAVSARSTVSRPGTSSDGAGEINDFQLTIVSGTGWRVVGWQTETEGSQETRECQGRGDTSSYSIKIAATNWELPMRHVNACHRASRMRSPMRRAAMTCTGDTSHPGKKNLRQKARPSEFGHPSCSPLSVTIRIRHSQNPPRRQKIYPRHANLHVSPHHPIPPARRDSRGSPSDEQTVIAWANHDPEKQR